MNPYRLARRRDFILSAAVFPLLAAESPWSPAEVLDPAQLAKQLASGAQASIFYVGFPVLYRAAHIPTAVLMGPCSKPQGLADLRAALAKLPPDRQVVLYCGCCPFDQCPNIRPAYTVARALHLTNLKILNLPTNLHTNWVAKEYPIEKSA